MLFSVCRDPWSGQICFSFFWRGLLVLGRLALLFSSDGDDGVGGIVWVVLLGCEGVGTFISGCGSLY